MNIKYHVCAVEGENKAIQNPDVGRLLPLTLIHSVVNKVVSMLKELKDAKEPLVQCVCVCVCVCV